VSTITANSVIFDDGEKSRFDAIIFATGYRPSYPDFGSGRSPAWRRFAGQRPSDDVFCWLSKSRYRIDSRHIERGQKSCA
jgi:hypothetical protein